MKGLKCQGEKRNVLCQMRLVSQCLRPWQKGDSLECAGLAALWSTVPWRRVAKKQTDDSKSGYKRWAKAAPGRRTPRRCFLVMVSDRFGLTLARGPGQSSGGG